LHDVGADAITHTSPGIQSAGLDFGPLSVAHDVGSSVLLARRDTCCRRYYPFDNQS